MKTPPRRHAPESPHVVLGQIYPCAGKPGVTAIVTGTVCEGLRPVSAIISGDGPNYTRYYTLEGHEYADRRASPYDLLVPTGAAAPDCKL